MISFLIKTCDGLLFSYHSVSGVTDHYADTETEGFEIGRDVVAAFNVPEATSNIGYDEPIYPVEELQSLIPQQNQHGMNMYKV